VKGGFVGEIQDFDVPQILIEGSTILLSTGRHLNSNQQLRLGDDGDAHGIDRNRLQSPKNPLMRTLHDAGRYIRV
jgi:hypothetical protein